MILEYIHSFVDKTTMESEWIINIKIKQVVVSGRGGRERGCDQEEVQRTSKVMLFFLSWVLATWMFIIL